MEFVISSTAAFQGVPSSILFCSSHHGMMSMFGGGGHGGNHGLELLLAAGLLAKLLHKRQTSWPSSSPWISSSWISTSSWVSTIRS
ncbi:hypothetical protein CEXT_691791 [Caerostris extrusa]|uniref:Uncharacterized protein n=1 Tax=Caerostris extrusa TaxID=172846 RepID=A0AAV4M5U0_CAEEX|nr:hypothetical protein CEXT_691791 [Caerostris extrusa]